MLVSCQITETNTVTSHIELINHGSDVLTQLKLQCNLFRCKAKMEKLQSYKVAIRVQSCVPKQPYSSILSEI